MEAITNNEQTPAHGETAVKQKQIEALLEMNRELREHIGCLNEAQNLTGTGSWSWILSGNYVHRSEAFFNILGRTSSELEPTYEAFLCCVHEDDRASFKELVSCAIAEKAPLSMETRIQIPDGSVKTVLIHGKAVFGQQGNLMSLHGTIEDITDRKTHETALVQTNEELKRSNEELDRFVYGVSHDLRSPLLSMGGIVDITREETEEELTREHMTMLKGSISRLDNFIGEILSYSRNASGGLKVSTVDFKQLLTEISNDLRYMSGNAKRVDILVDIDQQDEFHTDHGRFRIIMNNLISNAIRYHNPHADNPYVKIRATAGRQTTLIEIEDNGIGIPAKHQEKVFEMFYRVSENSCGSGLGLYIVKETVEKLKGNIRIESSEGIGTKCIINLPNLFTNN